MLGQGRGGQLHQLAEHTDSAGAVAAARGALQVRLPTSPLDAPVPTHGLGALGIVLGRHSLGWRTIRSCNTKGERPTSARKGDFKIQKVSSRHPLKRVSFAVSKVRWFYRVFIGIFIELLLWKLFGELLKEQEVLPMQL